MMTEAKRKLLGGVGLTLVVLVCHGCWSKKDDPKRDAEPPKFNTFPAPPPGGSDKFGAFPPPPPGSSDDDNGRPTSELDFSGLKGVLAGKWKVKDGYTLDFTSGSTVTLNRYGTDKFAKYELKEGILTFTTEWDGMRRAGAALRGKTANPPNEYVYSVEFLSDGELSLRLDRSGDGFDWFQLAGRWKRISLPPNRVIPVEGTGPIADAKRQVQKIEAKLTKLEAIQKAALADRDELVVKLRGLGVNSVTDLKGNIRGQQIAENLAKITAEIEGRDRQLALIDTELLKAKSIVRRMEQEQAGLTEEEMRSLALQLREVEDRTDRSSLPLTPIDVDSAVEKALKKN
jgi:hypothetical protein